MAEDGSSLLVSNEGENNGIPGEENVNWTNEAVAPSKTAGEIEKEFSNAAQKRQNKLNAAVLNNKTSKNKKASYVKNRGTMACFFIYGKPKKRGCGRNHASLKIQYPMKNRCNNMSALLNYKI